MTSSAIVRDDMAEPVRRIRVTLVHRDSGAAAVDEHLRVELPAPASRAVLADVVHAEGEGPAQAAELAADHPGALVVAVHRGHRCWIRFTCHGFTRVLTIHRPDARYQGEVWGILASLAHGWLGAGLPAECLAPVLSSAAIRIQSAAGSLNRSSRVRTLAADRDRPAAEYLFMASW